MPKILNDDEFEEIMLEILTSPKPNPKYPLWARTNKGQIVGYHYESVGYCFNRYEHRSFAGWHYHLLTVDESGISESEIEVCEESELRLIAD